MPRANFVSAARRWCWRGPTARARPMCWTPSLCCRTDGAGVAPSSSADLGDIVQLIWLTPAMDRLFIESAGGRRRFLDRLVLGFDTGHAHAATRYETAMRERARLLK